MATPFLTSEEYDERAHRLYDAGDYEGALRLLQEGLRLYPHTVDLHVGLGFTRLAREEFVWAKHSFEKALVLDPENEDAMVGLGEALFRFGRRSDALALFNSVREAGRGADPDLLLAMGRALYRERLYDRARDIFEHAARLDPEAPDPLAALGYTLHRLGDIRAARRKLRHALRVDPEYHEARVYLGHLMYDRGAWQGALNAFARVPPAEHWDPLAIWRLLELKRALEGVRMGDPEMIPWEARLGELETDPDPVDELLAEVQAGATDAGPAVVPGMVDVADPLCRHRIRTREGAVYTGSWEEIVRQFRDARGLPGETVAQFMKRQSQEARLQRGVLIPWDEPETFLRASARAGLLTIEF